MPGPLPNPNARRRNQPTIPTTALPPKGRPGRPPAIPRAYRLGPAGAAWWKWAWKTPQAARWDVGALYAVARRAKLEDDLALVDELDSKPLDLADLVGLERNDVIDTIEWTIKALKGLAGKSLAIMKEARELDMRLGLTPKAMADLRWSIGGPEEVEPARPSAAPPATVRRLRAVDLGGAAQDSA